MLTTREIVFLQNLHSQSAIINTATYIAFIIIMFLAVPVSLLLVPSETVLRSDDTVVKIPGSRTWMGTLLNLARRLRSDPHIIAFFPIFFVSSYYLPHQFNDINLATFNIRTRALNVILFYAAGVPGAYAAGYVLDTKYLRRSVRIKLSLVILIALFVGIWGGAYAWQAPVTRHETENPRFHLIDCTDSTYIGPMFLFLAFGFVHFVFQNAIYWYMAVLADSSATTSAADFAGFIKSLQAVGAAVAWRLSNLQLPIPC